MQTIKIANPNRLVEIYNVIAPNHLMKYRGSSGDTYKFGIQPDNTQLWDRFLLQISKEIQVVYHPESFAPNHYVKLSIHDVISYKNEITNTIKLEEFKNPQKVIEHMLDGMTQIVANIG
jgi:hypothetical protein